MSAATAAMLNGISPQADPRSDWVSSRGLHYGDGVFRTLLRHGSQWIDWSAQMTTLAQDAAMIDLDAPPAELLRAEADALAADQPACVLKILLWRAAADRGYRSDTRVAERLLLRDALPEYSARLWTQGIEAFLSDLRLAPQPRLAGIKHLNRLEQVLASRNWPPAAQEGVLLSHAGNLVCGTRSNLFWVSRGRLFTPDLQDCGVAGVMRGRLLALAAQLNLQIETGVYPLQDLPDADEAFVSNSLIGVWPLRRFADRSWSAPGAITQRLAAALAHPSIGRPIDNV